MSKNKGSQEAPLVGLRYEAIIPEEWQGVYKEGLEAGTEFANRGTLSQVVSRIRVETQWVQSTAHDMNHPDTDTRMDAAWRHYHTRGVLKALREALEGKR